MRALRFRVLASAILLWSLATPAIAVLPSEQLTDPAQEARALTLSKRLRCVVCQNQNIDDSAAPLAADMRVLLREQIKKGATDQEAVDFLVQRYGNYVLLKPPFQLDTFFLWLAPFGVLALGAALLSTQLRHVRAKRAAQPKIDEFVTDEIW